VCVCVCACVCVCVFVCVCVCVFGSQCRFVLFTSSLRILHQSLICLSQNYYALCWYDAAVTWSVTAALELRNLISDDFYLIIPNYMPLPIRDGWVGEMVGVGVKGWGWDRTNWFVHCFNLIFKKLFSTIEHSFAIIVKSSQESFIPKHGNIFLLQVDKQCTNKNQWYKHAKMRKTIMGDYVQHRFIQHNRDNFRILLIGRPLIKLERETWLLWLQNYNANNELTNTQCCYQ
jgi:hypothetical protein